MSFFNRRNFFSASSEGGGPVEDFMGMQGCPNMPGHGPWIPPADIFETPDGVVARFELAGVRVSDLELKIVGASLRLRGKREECCKKVKKVYRQMEIHYGFFERVIALPCQVNAEQSVARYQDGLLEVFLPRTCKQIQGVIVISI